MADIESIMRTFLTLGKTADSAELAQGVKTVQATGEQFMGIGLVANVPDNLVFRGVQHPMQG